MFVIHQQQVILLQAPRLRSSGPFAHVTTKVVVMILRRPIGCSEEVIEEGFSPPKGERGDFHGSLQASVL